MLKLYAFRTLLLLVLVSLSTQLNAQNEDYKINRSEKLNISEQHAEELLGGDDEYLYVVSGSKNNKLKLFDYDFNLVDEYNLSEGIVQKDPFHSNHDIVYHNNKVFYFLRVFDAKSRIYKLYLSELVDRKPKGMDLIYTSIGQSDSKTSSYEYHILVDSTNGDFAYIQRKTGRSTKDIVTYDIVVFNNDFEIKWRKEIVLHQINRVNAYGFPLFIYNPHFYKENIYFMYVGANDTKDIAEVKIISKNDDKTIKLFQENDTQADKLFKSVADGIFKLETDTMYIGGLYGYNELLTGVHFTKINTNTYETKHKLYPLNEKQIAQLMTNNSKKLPDNSLARFSLLNHDYVVTEDGNFNMVTFPHHFSANFNSIVDNSIPFIITCFNKNGGLSNSHIIHSGYFFNEKYNSTLTYGGKTFITFKSTRADLQNKAIKTGIGMSKLVQNIQLLVLDENGEIELRKSLFKNDRPYWSPNSSKIISNKFLLFSGANYSIYRLGYFEIEE